MSSTFEGRLKANYDKALDEGRSVLAFLCTILLKGIPITDKFIGLSNGAKKKLGYNQAQIAHIEGGLALFHMDISVLHLNIRSFGGPIPNTLQDLLSKFKKLRNDWVHEKQIMSFDKTILIAKLSELKILYTSMLEEVKNICEPSNIPSINYQILDIAARLLSLEKSLDDEIQERTIELLAAAGQSTAVVSALEDTATITVERTEELMAAAGKTTAAASAFENTAKVTVDALEDTRLKFEKLIKSKDATSDYNKQMSKESLLITAVSEGDLSTITDLVRHATTINEDIVQVAKGIASEKGDDVAINLLDLIMRRQASDRAQKSQQQLDLDVIKSVLDKDVARLRTALAQGGSPNVLCTFVSPVSGNTFKDQPVLKYATLVQSIPMMEALLSSHTIDVDLCTVGGYTALMAAVLVNNISAATLLLTRGADPNLPSGEHCRPPIVEAALRGHTAIVQLLISHNADPDGISSTGYTAMYVAAQRGHRAVIEILISGGADPQLLHPTYKDTAADNAKKWGFEELSIWLRKQRKQTRN